MTSRESHHGVQELQDEFGWPVLIQEQEAYLLPGLAGLTSFGEEDTTISGLRILWTPGPTPGSCVVHAPHPWNVLFCGRLLIPVNSLQIVSLRNRSTFHWSIQQKSLKKLRDWLPSEASPLLASGSCLPSNLEKKLFAWESWKWS